MCWLTAGLGEKIVELKELREQYTKQIECLKALIEEKEASVALLDEEICEREHCFAENLSPIYEDDLIKAGIISARHK